MPTTTAVSRVPGTLERMGYGTFVVSSNAYNKKAARPEPPFCGRSQWMHNPPENLRIWNGRGCGRQMLPDAGRCFCHHRIDRYLVRGDRSIGFEPETSNFSSAKGG